MAPSRARLVNVRLDLERQQKVLALRDRGVTLSDVVREAIDQRYLTIEPESPRDVAAIVSLAFALYPDPDELPPREYDVHDRQAARRAILRTLRSPRA